MTTETAWSFTAAEQQQYKPQLLLEGVGYQGQTKLKNAAVLCIGAGGLGSPLLLYLAGAGIGTIGIVDDDVVELSNLQRQILYSHADLGNNKANAAKHRLNALNPFIDCIAYPQRLTTENAQDIFKQYTVIADCSDNFATRYLINHSCIALNKPLVSASVSKFKGQCGIFVAQQGPCYQCVFPPSQTQALTCSESGILGVVPGILGSIQAAEIIKYILGIGTSSLGKLLQVDLLSLQYEFYNFSKDPHCLACHNQSQPLRLPPLTPPCASNKLITS